MSSVKACSQATKDMLYRFNVVNEALQSCTSYYAELHYDNDEECYTYWVVDGCGDRDGDPFYDIDDMIDYIVSLILSHSKLVHK